MIDLGVNIDHVATLRQARRTYEPDPVWAAAAAHLGGADCITVHLREDRRHIVDRDVELLRASVQSKLNLEMAATDEMVGIACRLKPEMSTLVPEGRHEVTTEGGLDVAGQEARLKDVVRRMQDAGIYVSLFIDADPKQIEAAARVGAQACEIHTGPYAHAFHDSGRDIENPAAQAELQKVGAGGTAIIDCGMRFNAGHALNYVNVQPIAALPGLRELHIGHAIVSRAVFVGLSEAVREMKRLIREVATPQVIYGIGTDLVAIERMTLLWQRHGERALEKLLAPEERAACLASTAPGRFLAKRFAAKEAFGKALGTGIRAPVLLPAIAVVHDGQGKPAFAFDADLAAWIEERHLISHLSISDEAAHALAFVVVEQI